MSLQQLQFHVHESDASNDRQRQRHRRCRVPTTITTMPMMMVTMMVMITMMGILAAAASSTTTTSVNDSSSSFHPQVQFPGVYTLRTNGHWQQWKDVYQEEEVASTNSLEPIWLHMDVLDIDCNGSTAETTMGKEEGAEGGASSNNINNNEYHHQYCDIHTLIQSSDEYDQLWKRMSMSQLLIHNNNDEDDNDHDGTMSDVIFFRYNATLTQEWIEPRLQNKQKQQQNRRQVLQAQSTSLWHLQQEQLGESNSTSSTTSSTITQGYSTIASHQDCYLDYAGMMAWIQDYVQQAMDTGLLHVELLDIGDSFFKASGNNGDEGEEGNDIHVLTLTGSTTNTSTAAPMLLLSSIHAREYAPPEAVRRFLLHILDYVQTNNSLPPYLETTQIHWVPYVNVDGRILAETTEPWRRKNLNRDWNSMSNTCADDAYGVDLNRNYPFQWGVDGGSSLDACSPFSRGNLPASEPETQAVVTYAASIFPKTQREQPQQAAFAIQLADDPPIDTIPDTWKGFNETTTKGVFVDLHSYGQVFIYPWGNVNKPTPNHDAIEAPLGKLQQVIGYKAMGPGDNFYGAASGATDDAMYALFGPLSMTWELGSAFHERCEDFDKELPYLLQGLEYLASIAPAPYTLGQGPDITEATAVPSVIQEGESMTLTVAASDSSKQSMDVSTAEQSVVELRLYLDHPLVVGNENSLAVAVWNVNDSGWAVTDDNGGVSFSTSATWEDLILARGSGSHTLYVQALDSDGHWGPIATMNIQLKSREGSLPESKSPTTPTPVAAVESSSTPPSSSPSMQPSSSSPSMQPSALLLPSSSNTIPAEPNRLSTPSPTTVPPEEPRTSVVPSVEEASVVESDAGDADRTYESGSVSTRNPRGARTIMVLEILALLLVAVVPLLS